MRANSADASAYLEFDSIANGRCQVLSDGGKLRVLRNLHASRSIDYRLIRMFAGNHPQGRVAGVIAGGSAPVELGCTRVDGRAQDWILERARFAQED